MENISAANVPTLEDFFEEGRALEATIGLSSEACKSERSTIRALASECREIAVGIIAITLSHIDDLLVDTPFQEEISYFAACIYGFAQGAPVSSSLILHGQYMRAAAVLKQDVELLARLHEIWQGRHLTKMPNVGCGPEGMGRLYGELNKVAHPSSLDAMFSVLGSQKGSWSIFPLHNELTESALFHWHVWLCTEVARAAISLFSALIDAGPDAPEAKANLESCIKTFDSLCEIGKALGKNP